MTKRTQIAKRMKTYHIPFSEASIEDDFIIVRGDKSNYDFPFSKEDLIKNKIEFKTKFKKYFNLNTTKKLNRKIKYLKWYDYSHFLQLLKLGLDKHSAKIIDEVFGDGYDFYNKKEVESKRINPIFHKLDDEFIDILISYAKWIACEYYYYGVAIDSEVKDITDSLLLFAHYLEENDVDMASQVFIENLFRWWD